MERVKVLSENDRKRISHITAMVHRLLSKKTMFEKQRQDENNKTLLGGVSFFYKFDEKEKGIIENVTLVWDVHPSEWQEAAIIQEIRDQEAYMDKANETGEAFGSNPFYNPFQN